MLKLTVKPGEYVLVGNDVKVVFAGGSANNMHILIDAPKSMNIARSSALEKNTPGAQTIARHYKDRELSPEAQGKIKAILMEERRRAKPVKQA